MPRRGGVPKRDVLPDPIYNSKVITKLINQVMYDGKKGIAQRIVYDAFDIIKEKTGREAMEVFNQAMENIMPMVETKARRVGGSNYQVPIEVRPDQASDSGPALACNIYAQAQRAYHEGAARRRDYGRGQQ